MSSKGASETTKKIRAAVEVKLKELGTKHDRELPDYIIMMIANRKTRTEMKKSLKMFIGSKHSEEFTTWLYKVLELLHALSGKNRDSPFAVRSKESDPEKEPKKRDSSSESKKKHRKRKVESESEPRDPEKSKRQKENVPEGERIATTSQEPSPSTSTAHLKDRRVIEVGSNESSSERDNTISPDGKSGSRNFAHSRVSSVNSKDPVSASSLVKCVGVELSKTKKPAFRLKIPTKSNSKPASSRRNVELVPANNSKSAAALSNSPNEEKDTLFVNENKQKSATTKFVITLGGHGEIERKSSTDSSAPEVVKIVRPSFSGEPGKSGTGESPEINCPKSTDLKKPNPFSGFSFKGLPKFTSTLPSAEPPLKVSAEEVKSIVPIPKPAILESSTDQPKLPAKFGTFKFESFKVTAKLSDEPEKSKEEPSFPQPKLPDDSEGLQISENLVINGLFGSKSDSSTKVDIAKEPVKETTFSITFGGIEGLSSVKRDNLKNVENFHDDDDDEDLGEDQVDIDGDSDFDDDEKQIFEELMKEDGLLDAEGNPLFNPDEDEEERTGSALDAEQICDSDVINANCASEAGTTPQPPANDQPNIPLGPQVDQVADLPNVAESGADPEKFAPHDDQQLVPISEQSDNQAQESGKENSHPPEKESEAELGLVQISDTALDGSEGPAAKDSDAKTVIETETREEETEGAGELFLDEIDLEMEEAAEKVLAEQNRTKDSDETETSQQVDQNLEKAPLPQTSQVSETPECENESVFSEPIGPALSTVSNISQKKVMVVLPMRKEPPEESVSEATIPVAEDALVEDFNLDLQLHSEDEKLIEANLSEEATVDSETTPSKRSKSRSKKDDNSKSSRDKKKKSKRSKHHSSAKTKSSAATESRRTVRIEGRHFMNPEPIPDSFLISPKGSRLPKIFESEETDDSKPHHRHKSHSKQSGSSEKRRKRDSESESSHHKSRHKKRSHSKERKRSHSRSSEKHRTKTRHGETAEPSSSLDNEAVISEGGSSNNQDDSIAVNPLFLVMEGVGNSLRERILDRMKKKALAGVKSSTDKSIAEQISVEISQQESATNEAGRPLRKLSPSSAEFKINTNFGNSPADIALRNSEKIDDILARLGPIQPVSIDLDQDSDSGEEEEGEIKEPREKIKTSKSLLRPAPASAALDRGHPSGSWVSGGGGGGGRGDQCRFWPNCRNTACTYSHPPSGNPPTSHHHSGSSQFPTTPCRAFPNCRFGDRCRFMHPLCKFDPYCNRVGCRFSHSKTQIPDSRDSYQYGSGPSSGMSHPPAPPQFFHPLPVACPHGRNCASSDCPFNHPAGTAPAAALCRFGSHCALRNCTLRHEATPSPRSRSGSAASRRSGTPRGYQ